MLCHSVSIPFLQTKESTNCTTILYCTAILDSDIVLHFRFGCGLGLGLRVRVGVRVGLMLRLDLGLELLTLAFITRRDKERT